MDRREFGGKKSWDLGCPAGQCVARFYSSRQHYSGVSEAAPPFALFAKGGNPWGPLCPFGVSAVKVPTPEIHHKLTVISLLDAAPQ